MKAALRTLAPAIYYIDLHTDLYQRYCGEFNNNAAAIIVHHNLVRASKIGYTGLRLYLDTD
ncbi:hypothetical protein KIN20_010978 [Parelaphostrongylus tenuis]|uniref:Uncharacterized protein n=1 Tax=Parelaphostrongylus tenuis TaxID=148309 RepID=A0AAD5QLR4_PARTN|nr:hypothetical protein KIN20_010978 [Parelaphostrongylus tenuis]